MEALIFHRNYYNSALQTNVTSSVIGLCSSSFISSPKLLIGVVLVLVPSCLLLLVQIQSISISKLFVCLFRIEVPSCLYVLIQFQLYAVCSPISSYSSSSKLFACQILFQFWLYAACLFLVLVFSSKLRKNCSTRWDSLFLVICHMLEVKENLTTVLEELEWENLNVAQREH